MDSMAQQTTTHYFPEDMLLTEDQALVFVSMTSGQINQADEILTPGCDGAPASTGALTRDAIA